MAFSGEGIYGGDVGALSLLAIPCYLGMAEVNALSFACNTVIFERWGEGGRSRDSEQRIALLGFCRRAVRSLVSGTLRSFLFVYRTYGVIRI